MKCFSLFLSTPYACSLAPPPLPSSNPSSLSKKLTRKKLCPPKDGQLVERPH